MDRYITFFHLNHGALVNQESRFQKLTFFWVRVSGDTVGRPVLFHDTSCGPQASSVGDEDVLEASTRLGLDIQKDARPSL